MSRSKLLPSLINYWRSGVCAYMDAIDVPKKKIYIFVSLNALHLHKKAMFVYSEANPYLYLHFFGLLNICSSLSDEAYKIALKKRNNFLSYL